MNINVKSTSVLKTGNNQRGEWVLVKVATETDEYTTFAEDARNLAPGTVIDITDFNQDSQGRKSFKTYEMLQVATTSPVVDEKPPMTHPAVISPQTPGEGAARGMSVKELGDMMRAGLLTKIFGEPVARSLTVWYRGEILAITKISVDGKDLPKFE